MLNKIEQNQLQKTLAKAFTKAFAQAQKDGFNLKKFHWFKSEEEKNNTKMRQQKIA